MQAGLLREIITVEKCTITRMTDGSEKMTWCSLWRGRARVEQTSGTMANFSGETFNTATKRITIRTKPAINEVLSTIRVNYAGKYYRVLSLDVRHWDMATIMVVELINQ